MFTRSAPDVERPDIQFHMQPLSADKPGEGPHKFSAFTASVCQLRPESRGHVRIKSADPLQYPSIQPNYLSTELDCRVAVGGLKVARRIAAAPPLASQITEEFVPGAQYQSDDELLEAARRFSQTIYHPTSTCRMGPDNQAVVDARLRVHGIEGYGWSTPRSCRRSSPAIPTHATIMIAEKAADMILEDARGLAATTAKGAAPRQEVAASV